MVKSDVALLRLVEAIIAGEVAVVSRLLSESPQLARASFETGATRHSAEPFFLDRIGRYIYAGDTALHIAAAAYQTESVSNLLAAGANVHARNRRGQEALHAASCGSPGSATWSPSAQTATITRLIEAEADPNALDKSGVSPLHKAVRTRCAAAVQTLLHLGADFSLKNKSGSTPLLLARLNTGRGGTGSEEAKFEQQQIVRLLEERVR
jgi:ankyrin repeat protein